MNRPRRPGCRIEGLIGIATSSFRMRMTRTKKLTFQVKENLLSSI